MAMTIGSGLGIDWLGQGRSHLRLFAGRAVYCRRGSWGLGWLGDFRCTRDLGTTARLSALSSQHEYTAHDARTLCREERSLQTISPHGRIRVAVGYPNTYHVAMSSLAFQWIVRLAASVRDVGVERFVTDSHLAGRTIEGEAPLGNFDVLAFTCSFEPDAVNLLNVLDAAGIPRRWRQRNAHHPLIIVGGATASINPLPMSEAVDIFVLGAAELLWPNLLRSIRDTSNRDYLLADLAGRDGFFIPGHHLDNNGNPSGRRRRLEKRDRHMLDPEAVPASHIVTPHTEYKDRGPDRDVPRLSGKVQLLLGQPQLRPSSLLPADAIMARIDELSRITNRIGFVATAIGDHPDLAAILYECRERKPRCGALLLAFAGDGPRCPRSPRCFRGELGHDRPRNRKR